MSASPPLPHEWHAVGNISGCRHCHRAEHMINARPEDECPVRLRARIDALEAERYAAYAAIRAALGKEG